MLIPSQQPAAHQRATTALDERLHRLQAALDEGDSETAKHIICELRKVLTPSKGVETRPGKGGCQYNDNYMLNIVLLADNLKPMPKEDVTFLSSVVHQPTAYF